MTTDANEPAGGSGGYAIRGDLIARAFREIEDAINAASKAHATNYTKLFVALVAKGILTEDDLYAATPKAESIVNDMFKESLARTHADRAAKVREMLEGLTRKA